MEKGDRQGSELRQRLLAGEVRALARVISLIEASDQLGQQLLAELRPEGGRAHVLGVTGAPGSGKSTLTDMLVAAYRQRGERVAVIAVDPSSPFTGGAILGDRIRMTRWHSDPGVYIRSMAARGHLGGLAAATLQVVALLDAVGFGNIVIETVGVGQSEVEIAEAADTTVLVLTPGQGDAVQAFKAGIMEIADLYVINKSDQPGAARLRGEITSMLEISHHEPSDWLPPIVETVASQGQGLEALTTELDRHAQHLRTSGLLDDLRRRRARFEISAILEEELRRSLAMREDDFVEAVISGSLTPSQAVAQLLER